MTKSSHQTFLNSLRDQLKSDSARQTIPIETENDELDRNEDEIMQELERLFCDLFDDADESGGS